MPHSRSILVGMRIPGVMVAELDEGQVRPVSAHDVLGRGRTLCIGVPGAFTPVCTERHVPSLVRSAERLRRSGFDHLVCMVASDPFATDAWQRVVDPKRWIRFVSDGNLNFCRALALNTHEQSLFLGDRSERYLLVVQSGAIEKVRIEQRITDYSCTHPADFILEQI